MKHGRPYRCLLFLLVISCLSPHLALGIIRAEEVANNTTFAASERVAQVYYHADYIAKRLREGACAPPQTLQQPGISTD